MQHVEGVEYKGAEVVPGADGDATPVIFSLLSTPFHFLDISMFGRIISGRSRVNNDRHGVRLVFTVTGSIGHFDIFQMLTQRAAGLARHP